MTTREFKRVEFMELVEGTKPTDVQPWKWGTRKTYVFELDGKHWAGDIEVHVTEGWRGSDEDTVTCSEVRQVEKVVKVWEPVP